MAIPKKKTSSPKSKKVTLSGKAKASSPKKHAASTKKAAPTSHKKNFKKVEKESKPRKEMPDYFGYDAEEWRDLKQVIVIAAFKGKISKIAKNYEDRQVVALVKKFVLSRGRVHIEKAAAALTPGADDAWAALFRTR